MTDALVGTLMLIAVLIIWLVWQLDTHVKRCWVFRQDKYGGFTASTSYTKIFWSPVRYTEMDKGKIRFHNIDKCIDFMQKELPDKCNVDVKFIMDMSHSKSQEKV